MLNIKKLKIYKPKILKWNNTPLEISGIPVSYLFDFNILDFQNKITKCGIHIEMARLLKNRLTSLSDNETENKLKCEKIVYQEALNHISKKIENNQLEELIKKPDNENPRIEELEKQPKPDLSLSLKNEDELIRYDLDEIDLKYDEYIELLSTEVLLAKIYHILLEKFSNKKS